MISYNVMQSYLSGAPDSIEGENDEHVCAQVQAFADAKKVNRARPAIGVLEFDVMTDQIDAWFRRDGRRLRFMTLMA